VSQQYFVCSDHFIDSQFVDDSKQRLSRGAVPTLFEFNDQNAVPVEIIDGDEIIVEGEYVCVCARARACTCKRAHAHVSCLCCAR
jgi:hypothetical protein